MYPGSDLLHVAAANGCADVVAYLINCAGMPISSRSKDGALPIHLASTQPGQLPVVKYFIEKLNVNPGVTAADG